MAGCRCWALSCFPMPPAAWPRCGRVVRRGGRISVVTWTQPQNYELAAELRAAIQSVWPDQPQAPLPAQLRYREEDDFRALFQAAGLGKPVDHDRHSPPRGALCPLALRTHRLCARHGRHDGWPWPPSDLSVIQRFVENLETRLGTGPDQPLWRSFHRDGTGSVTFSPVAREDVTRREPLGDLCRDRSPSTLSLCRVQGRQAVAELGSYDASGDQFLAFALLSLLAAGAAQAQQAPWCLPPSPMRMKRGSSSGLPSTPNISKASSAFPSNIFPSRAILLLLPPSPTIRCSSPGSAA